MGYTHYYTLTSKPVDAEKRYKSFAAGAAVIINQAVDNGIQIANWSGEDLYAWQANYDAVRFNGYSKYACETFTWRSDVEENQFNFTKTWRQPYDAAVTACLILLKKIYGEHVEVSSDGTWDEWEPGRELYYQALNEVAPFPFDYVEVEV